MSHHKLKEVCCLYFDYQPTRIYKSRFALWIACAYEPFKHMFCARTQIHGPCIISQLWYITGTINVHGNTESFTIVRILMQVNEF
jgi:hypothetical protein